MNILAIDPGNIKSAVVEWDGAAIKNHEIIENEHLFNVLRAGGAGMWQPEKYRVVIEMVASYGMPVGKEVFETVLWIGKFCGAWAPWETELVYRKDIKMHLCGSMRAKDGNIRQAILDRFGGREAIGKKETPGPLYGIKKDEWSALAVALYFSDCHKKEGEV